MAVGRQPLIKPDHRAMLECRCGHRAVVILPCGVLLPEVKRRGRCTACGKFGVIAVTVLSPAQDECLGGYLVWPDGTRQRYEAGERKKVKEVWPDR